MSELNVLSLKDFDINRVVLSGFVPKKKDGKIVAGGDVAIKYRYNDNDEPDKLIIQSPKMWSPFGICNNEKFRKDNESDSSLKYALKLSMDSSRNPKVDMLRDVIDQLNRLVLSKVLENSGKWMNDDDHDERSIKKIYNSIIRKNKSKVDDHGNTINYPDSLVIQVNWDTELARPSDFIEFYDETGNPTEWKNLVSGSEVVCLFVINRIALNPAVKSFNLKNYLLQVQVFKPKTLSKQKGVCHIKFDQKEESSDPEMDDSDEVEVEVEVDELEDN